MDELAKIRQHALNLLARREHSRLELKRKLSAKNYQHELIDQIVNDLATNDLQSDYRFADIYIRSRANRGYGPVRIANELIEKGIVEQQYQSLLNQHDWNQAATMTREKKFGSAAPENFEQKAQQMRFLYYRGYTTDQTKAALRSEDE